MKSINIGKMKRNDSPKVNIHTNKYKRISNEACLSTELCPESCDITQVQVVSLYEISIVFETDFQNLNVWPTINIK